LSFFNKGEPGIPAVPGMGGSIEPLSDEDGVLLTDKDGVLLAENNEAVMTLDLAALDADIEATSGSEPSPPETQILP